MHRSLLVMPLVMALVALTSAQSGGRSGAPGQSDWTQWRGTNRDAAIVGFRAPSAWPEQLTARWKTDIGLGYATPLLVGNRMYVFSRQGDNEVMSALDPANGSVLWRREYPAPFTMHSGTTRHGAGPKSTPVFADGKLFCIGMTGVVTAYDAASGKQLWQKPGSPIVPTFTTHAFSPLVERGLVVFHVGGHNQGAITAFDVNSGEVKWSWPGDGPSYGSPIIAELEGTRQIIALTQSKLVGLDAASGALLWERPFVSNNNTNSATPVLHGRTVILSNGGPAVGINVVKRQNQWAAEPAWENADVPFRLSNAVIEGDLLFGLSTRNSGQYFGVDAPSGKTLWTSEPRQAANAAILKAGDLLFSLEDDGELVVVRSSRTSFEPVRRYKLSDGATWTVPVISGNRVFVKNESTLALWTID
jgi:outer membrane protein assembly factor BamB